MTKRFLFALTLVSFSASAFGQEQSLDPWKSLRPKEGLISLGFVHQVERDPWKFWRAEELTWGVNVSRFELVGDEKRAMPRFGDRLRLKDVFEIRNLERISVGILPAGTVLQVIYVKVGPPIFKHNLREVWVTVSPVKK